MEMNKDQTYVEASFWKAVLFCNLSKSQTQELLRHLLEETEKLGIRDKEKETRSYENGGT